MLASFVSLPSAISLTSSDWSVFQSWPTSHEKGTNADQRSQVMTGWATTGLPSLITDASAL
jgi:hypothetical protein